MQTAQVSLNETVSLMTQLEKGGKGFDRMNSGRMCEEDSGRKGARETIQHVEKKMAVNEKRSARMTLSAFSRKLLSVQFEEQDPMERK